MTAKEEKGRFPFWVWLLFSGLYVLLVPWWASFGGSEGTALWLGLPRWVVLSYITSVVVALVANVVLHGFWPRSGSGAQGEGKSGGVDE